MIKAFKLGKNIKTGQKIKSKDGWREVLEVNENGVTIKEGFVKFGQTIYGWKIK